MEESQVGSTAAHPTGLAREGDQAIVISWSDGACRRYRAAELREACPCASCREKRNEQAAGSAKPANPLQVIPLAETKPVTITGMKPVGNYAYGIEFSDGHDTGIFTLDRLRGLGEEVS